MQHQEIISKLEDLLPQMRDTGSPRDVMLKYAREADLAPAQLERMAQLFNVAKSLDYMNKSANRGGTFDVVNIPDMLRDYTSYTPKKVAASSGIAAWIDAPANNNTSGLAKAASSSTSTMDIDDISAWVDAPAPDMHTHQQIKQAYIKEENGSFCAYSGHGRKLGTHSTKQAALDQLGAVKASKLHKSASMPDVMALARDSAGWVSIPQEVEDYQMRTAVGFVEQNRKEAAAAFELDSINRLIEDSKEEFRKLASTVYDQLTVDGLSFAEMEQDAVEHLGAAGVKAAAALSDYMTQLRVPHTRHDTAAATRKMAFERHAGSVELFKQAALCVDLIKAAQLYREDYISKSAVLATSLGDVLAHAQQQAAGAAAQQSASTPTPTPAGSGSGGNGGGGGGNGGGGLPPRPRTPRRNANDVAELIDPGYVEEDDKDDDDLAKTTTDIMNAVGAGLKRVPGPGAFSDTITSTIGRMGDGGAAQRKIDDAHRGVSAVTTLQRMLLTDPIIREADPEMVVSLFNTLQDAHPDVAHDPNLLRFALREALQYESVPLHTYKDLLGMETDKMRGRKERAGWESSQYRQPSSKKERKPDENK